MDKINVHSPTWSATEQWAKANRDLCVARLIEGTDRDEKLRGIIEAMDDLLALPNEAEPEPAPTLY